MYSAAIQRYFNEHIHLPYSFFQQPQRFIRHALKKKGAFMATAYNYVEPSEADNEDIIEYLGHLPGSVPVKRDPFGCTHR